MLNYRVQTCLDNQTYEALQKYLENNGYETVSVGLRKLIRDSLGVKFKDENGEECNIL